MGRLKVIVTMGVLIGVAGLAIAFDAESARASLREALATGKQADVDGVLKAILREGGAEAMDVVLDQAEKIPAGFDVPYWQILTAASTFVDRPALTALGVYIEKNSRKVIAADLLFALRGNSHENTVLAVGPILKTGPINLKRMAVDRLAALRTVGAMDLMIDTLEVSQKKDPAFHAELREALVALVGEDMGATANWVGWWRENRENGFPRRRAAGEGTGTVVDGLDPVHVTEFDRVKRCPGRVLCLQVEKCGRGGCGFDAIEFVLRRMGLRREVVERSAFEKADFDMKGVMAIILNCVQLKDHCICPKCKPSKGPKHDRMTSCEGCDEHIHANHRLSDNAVRRLKAFVEAGGYVFSEDWTLPDFVERAWPDKARSGTMLKEMDARVLIGRGAASHPLLRGCFEDPDIPDVPPEGPDPTDEPEEEDGDGHTVEPSAPEPATFETDHSWHIDDESPAIVVQPGGGVTVLLVSPDVRAKAQGADAIAITFRAGTGFHPGSDPGDDRPTTGGGHGGRAGVEAAPGGRVLHVLSHFGRQGSDLDEYALQSLLINFLGEAAGRWPQGK